MDGADMNYFTCTLGQARKLKEYSGQSAKQFPTILDLIDGQAELIPDAPAVGFATIPGDEGPKSPHPSLPLNDSSRSKERSAPGEVTFQRLRRLSLGAAISLSGVLNLRGKEDCSPTIGLLCTSSLDFILTWLGLLRLGCKAFLLAPQLEARAIIHLCETPGVDTILVDHANWIEQLPERFRKVGIPACGQAEELPPDIVLGGQRHAEGSSIAYLRHTSGTSSGLPKPISQPQWGAVGCLPAFPPAGQPATFSTTPLYHGGLADCFRAWTSGAMIWFFPEGAAPITGSNVAKAVTYACGTGTSPVKYFSSVPYVLQMLAETTEGVQLLRGMDLVGVGGAALPPSVGDKLVESGIRLVSRMGSAECGFLMSSHREYAQDKEWQYLRPIDDTSFLSFEARENGLSELVVKPSWPLRSKINRDDGSYATADLFEPHPVIHNAWRYHSRADAQITLANGKKFDPSPLEGAIRASTPLLRDVLIFGAGREYAGALLFKVSSENSDEYMLETVWPTIQALNHETQSHARLSKVMVLVLEATGAEEPLPKSSKGTILRHQADQRYADAIESAYSGRLATTAQVIPDGEVLQVLQDLFAEVLGKAVDPETDLYQQGVDSIACIQIKRMIESRVVPQDNLQLPINIIYDSGTIQNLAQHLIHLRHRSGPEDITIDVNEARLMQELALKYSDFQKSAPNRRGGNEKLVVTLTGATGILGAHILSQLIANPEVSKVYCLLRGKTLNAVQERVLKALEKRGLGTSTDLQQRLSSGGGKVVCLPCELSQSDLGLPAEDLARVKSESTVLIHSAWTVNFNLRLSSFGNHLAGIRNLLNTAVSGGGRFIFVSSTASVGAQQTKIIPEKISTNPAEASPLGYSRSKWVAEQICANAHDHAVRCGLKTVGPPVTVLRVGQLCGNEAGVWNASEAYPLMLSTAKLMGSLPDLPNESLNWLPVDIAARAVLELALTAQGDPTSAAIASLPPQEVPVYHVVNFHKTPTWSEMLACISKEPGPAPFKIVPAKLWVKDLESAVSTSKTKHPAQGLLGLWKRRYNEDDQEASSPPPGVPRDGNTGTTTLGITSTLRVSQTIRDVKPLDQVRILRMWNWILENVGNGEEEGT
ncbi:acetyl-CoA synthetase-like protein [Xylariomycetidae sp. FL2044]|nr:acetyl-CoA synthetase-like protein [Xylariomycetidae sp. FL2044]